MIIKNLKLESLRALLIQKSIKPDGIGMSELLGLRALLIQKSIKR